MRLFTYSGHANAQTELVNPTDPHSRHQSWSTSTVFPCAASVESNLLSKKMSSASAGSSTNSKKMSKGSRWLKAPSLIGVLVLVQQQQYCAHAFSTLGYSSRFASSTATREPAKCTDSVLSAHKVDSKGHGKTSSSRGEEDKKRPGWRRRVLSRFRRYKQHHHNMVATVVDETRHDAASLDQFVLDNFEKLSPAQLFSALEKQGYSLDLDSAVTTRGGSSVVSPHLVPEWPLEEEMTTTFAEDPSATESTLLQMGVAKSIIGATSSFDGGPPVTKVVRKWFQNLLVNTFTQWAVEPPVNLRVLCSPKGNVFWSIVRGQLKCNVRMDFDRIAFEPIHLSGGSIEGSDLALNLLAFRVDHSQEFNNTRTSNVQLPNANAKHTATSVQASKPAMKSNPAAAAEATNEKLVGVKTTTKVKMTSKDGKRYQTQFDLHANDCVLTQEDLFASKCVRNGLRNLLIRILRGRNIHPSLVDITSIEILDNGKISCKGEAFMKGTIGTTRVPFEVRSSINFKSRGHVLTFPGLEISLSPEVGLFVPVLPTVELDVGHNARLREILIDGTNKSVQVAASVTITPSHTLKVDGEKYSQSQRSYSARFSYDVGRWLTRIGRFSL